MYIHIVVFHVSHVACFMPASATVIYTATWVNAATYIAFSVPHNAYIMAELYMCR